MARRSQLRRSTVEALARDFGISAADVEQELVAAGVEGVRTAADVLGVLARLAERSGAAPPQLGRRELRALRGYGAEYRARRARRPGVSARAAVGHGTGPRPVTTRSVLGLSGRQQDSRQRAMRALGDMRHEGLSLSEAARRHGTSSDTVRRWAGPALQKSPRGRWVAQRSDSLPRIVPVVSNKFVYLKVAVSYRDAQVVSAHLRAIRHYLATGDEEPLSRFVGVTVRGRLPVGTLMPDGSRLTEERDVVLELEGDSEVVDALASAGDLDDLEVGS